MACLQGLLAIPVRSVLRPQPWLSTMTCPVSSLTHFPLCVFQAHLLSLGGFVRAVLPRAHRAWLREQAQQLLEQLDEASEGEEDDSLRASLASWPRRRVAATSRVDVLCCRPVPSPIPRHVGRRCSSPRCTRQSRRSTATLGRSGNNDYKVRRWTVYCDLDNHERSKENKM